MRKTMRNGKCGMRNVSGSVASRTTFHFNSALHIPHSAFEGVGQ